MSDETKPEYPPEWGEPRSRTVTWWDPKRNGVLASGLEGGDFQAAIIEGRLPPPPIAILFGSRLIEAGDGRSLLRCIPDESFYNPVGLIHGGFLCTLLDTAAGIAVQSKLPAGQVSATIEIKVSFLRPVRDDGRELEIRGVATKVGRRVAFAEAHAYDADGELLGHATTSLSVFEQSLP